MDISKELIEKYRSSGLAEKVDDRLQPGKSVFLKGAIGSLKSLVLADYFLNSNKQVVLLSPHSVEAEGAKEDLEALVGNDSVVFFPGSDSSAFGIDHSHATLQEARSYALEQLSENLPLIVVAHYSGLYAKLQTAETFRKKKMLLVVGEEHDFQKLVSILVGELDFVRESRVENSGEICVRGGIIDVFPYSSEFPYRIEFWGDSIESIRRFDPVTQRSIEKVRALSIYPQLTDAHEQAETTSTLLDFLSQDAVFFIDEPDRMKARFVETLATNNDIDEAKARESWEKVLSNLSSRTQAHLVPFGADYPDIIDFGAQTTESFGGSIKSLKKKLESHLQGRSNGFSTTPDIRFVCDSENQSSRLKEIFVDEGIDYPSFRVGNLDLQSGFIFPAANLIVYTDHQFYGRSKRLRLPKKSIKGLTPKQLKQLRPGDFVVHVDFGIGKYMGLKKVAVKGHEVECLQLEYRDGDAVYVRIERMDRVNKYSSKEGATPVLSKLGSAEWQRLKSRTKKKIKDIAQDLIKIYAKRKSEKGFQFSRDSLWQRELEASFPFEDTPDQVIATRQVKEDMESPMPMDRLVCGDVGFGKTEIAIRAAFKAVVDGKQVAMLVPTTILAYQHLNTFSTRLQHFPVKVEMLSRFRSRAEQRQIIEDLENGQIDIIIGTHRMLSKDVQFKDLGLLVVDEEQRFGVTHKEKLKTFRATIDVLTLTATPIPRTLQFSLMGARDMTNINTPPRNRLAIHTEILTFNKQYIRQAILRELERDGQAFFVHNRVQSIERIGRMVSDLVPEADVAIAHGQMPEKELEKIMVDFMNKKCHILVATMIIESGLDMPNVNTIIINRADMLGLAQLYQLRGRVGRSHQRAYAYLLIPPVETLTDDAHKRLRAIEEFSDLGSGAMLAMRDLEIRGAGNLLGAEQTGFIDSLGFELYNKIVDEAVRELKEENLPEQDRVVVIDTQVDIDADAFLPEDYIDSGSERVDIYKRLLEAEGQDSLDQVRSELEDRFGRLPEAVVNLIEYVSLRSVGQHLGIQTVRIEDNIMSADFADETLKRISEPFQEWIGSMLARANQPFEFFQDKGLGIRLTLNKNGQNKLAQAREFLSSLSDSQKN